MSRWVEWTGPALDDLARLDRRAQDRIREAVRRFAETGRGDIRKLSGREEEWRLRVGPWRVMFTFAETGIEIIRVLPRRDAYR